jgi:hypothetical protein
MKKTITLVVILFTTIFAFGQSKVHNTKNYPVNSSIEKHLKKIDAEKKLNPFSHLFKGNKISYQSSMFKSPGEIKQRLDSVITIEWEEPLSQWLSIWKDEFIYDGNGRIIQFIGYGWDETNNQWGKSEKEDVSYDASGNISQILGYDWDESTSQWMLEWKEEFTYDAGGKLIQAIDYHQSLSGWVYSHKYEYNYDANGNLIQFIYYGWDENASEWIPSWKYEYTYDTGGKIIEELSYEWEDGTSEWVINGKAEYSYDANDYLTHIIYFNWDDISNEWIFSDKEELIYDTAGNLSQNIYYLWNESTSQWEPWLKEEYVHDNSYTYSNLILPYYHEDVSLYFNHKVDSHTLFGWDDENNEWVEGYISDFYYSEQNVGSVVELGIEVSGIYPNPVSSKFMIEYTLKQSMPVTFQILNVSGQVVKILVDEQKQQGEQKIVFDGSGLKPGVYFVVLKTNPPAVLQTAKLVKL